MASRLFQVLLALSFIIAGTAIGQTLFGTTPSPPPSTSNSTSGVMSPSDFQKAVNSLGQQSQQQLMQQFKSQFNSGPGGNTMQIPATSTIIPSPPASSTIPTPVTPAVQQPAQPPKPVVQPAAAPPPQPQAAPPQQPPQVQIDNSAPAAPSQSPSVYTGFAPPATDKDSNSNSSNGNTPASGGWNIQY